MRRKVEVEESKSKSKACAQLLNCYAYKRMR
jgi:hypothetical protein